MSSITNITFIISQLRSYMQLWNILGQNTLLILKFTQWVFLVHEVSSEYYWSLKFKKRALLVILSTFVNLFVYLSNEIIMRQIFYYKKIHKRNYKLAREDLYLFVCFPKSKLVKYNSQKLIYNCYLDSHWDINKPLLKRHYWYGHIFYVIGQSFDKMHSTSNWVDLSRV